MAKLTGFLHAVGCLCVLLLSGCYYFQQADIPIEQTYYYRANHYQPSQQAGPPAADLLVMLPGMGDSIDRFYREGLIEQVKEVNLPMDVVVVNAHFNYYRSHSVTDRLQQDVMEPARAAGYRRIHFAGVSLGGLGALLYCQDVAGFDPAVVLLLTPYLGEPEHYEYLQTGAQPQALKDPENLWPWLETLGKDELEHWYIGSARQDKFYVPNTLLANRLGDDNVVVVEGEHDWTSWRQLWPHLLGYLQRDFYAEKHN